MPKQSVDTNPTQTNRSDITVTCLLLCYNQERYISIALQSILDQLESGMELIVSDDCSQDKTFELVESGCRTYKKTGVTLNARRNEHNLGVVAHLNELVRLSSGRLIVVGAGDDIAMPGKVSRIVEEWHRTGAYVLGCNPEIIDAEGNVIGRFYHDSFPIDFSCKGMIQRRNAGVFISAFDRKLFEEFGPLDGSLISEDQALPFRAAIHGADKIRIINEALVHYRAHTESMSSEMMFSSDKDSLDVMRRKISSFEKLYRGWVDELHNYEGGKDFSEEKRELIRRLGFVEAMKAIADEESFFKRFNKLGSDLMNHKISMLYLTQMVFFAISPFYVSEILGWLVQKFVYKGRKRGV